MYHKVLKKYRERKILQNIFMGTFGISAICIIIACSIGFSWFKNITQKEVIESEKKELSNYYLVLDNYITSAQDTLAILYKNAYVKRIITKGEMSWNDNMSIVANTVINTISVNPRLHSIFIFGDQGILLKTTNPSYPLTSQQDKEMEEFFQSSYLKRYNLVSYDDVYGQKKKILSMSMGELSLDNQNLQNGVMVNVDMGAICDEIFPNVGPKESYLILDYNFNVLGSNSEQYQFGDSVFSNKFIKSVINDTEKEKAMLVEDESGAEYVISYINSQADGYYLLHILPNDSFLSSVKRTQIMVVGIGVALSFIAFTISFIVAFKVYHPIDEVVDTISNDKKQKNKESQRRTTPNELTTIAQTMTSMVQKLNQFHEEKEQVELIRYLTGKSSNSQVPGHFIEDFEGREKTLSYQVAVLRICDVDDFVQNNTEEAIHFQMQTIANMAEQLARSIDDTNVVIIDNEYIAILLFYNETKNQGLVHNELSKILQMVNEMLSIKLDAGLSEVRLDLADIRQAYQSAKAATNYRFLYGMNSVISESQMQSCALRGVINIDTKSIIETVKKGDQDAFITQYQQIVKNLRGYSIQTAYEFLISLAVDMTKYQKDITQYTSGIKVSDLEQIRQEIIAFHYIEDTMPWFLDLFASICSTVSQVQNSGSTDIVSNAVHYIEENYMDVNLSAQFLAGKYNITPSYFSRIFNETCKCAFPDYLSGLRLEKAKQMLVEKPDKSIQSICEIVGYTSSSYFTAMFKKKYGITPSKFRMTQM